MKVAVFGNGKEKAVKEFGKHGFEVVEEKPEIVFVQGGDGTILLSEQKFPGIPKALVRGSKICHKCQFSEIEEAVKAVAEKKYSILEEDKIEAFLNGKKVFNALNDIVVYHKLPFAIRLNVFLNEKKIAENIIGDGLIASTSFGSTGYFWSVLKKKPKIDFKKFKVFENPFMAAALINPHTIMEKEYWVFSDKDVVRTEITRGPGIMSADNIENVLKLKEKDVVEIKHSKEKAKILKAIE